MPTYPASVTLVEVGLRDGLQVEPVIVPTEIKLAWIEHLIQAGLRHIQVGSFVHPARVPQMADTDALCSLLPEYEAVQFSGLALNRKGVERAIKAGLRFIDAGVSASDTHSIRNMGMPTAEALAEFARMAETARQAGVAVRGTVQVAFGCVYEGPIPLERVQRILDRYLEMGLAQVGLADSSGMANPRQMERVLSAIMPMLGDTSLVLHLHDTRGMAMANLYVALCQGVRSFDTSFGGLGGCPFIKGATGNIATEDTAYMLAQMGISTGVDVAQVARVSRMAQALLGHSLDSKLYRLCDEE